MSILINILLFVPRVVLTLLNTIRFLFCFSITFIYCFFILVGWCFTYSKLRQNGNGYFHKLFFKGPFSIYPFSVYLACKHYRSIWQPWGESVVTDS